MKVGFKGVYIARTCFPDVLGFKVNFMQEITKNTWLGLFNLVLYTNFVNFFSMALFLVLSISR